MRYIKNKKAFEKGTLANWSKTVHKIIDKLQHSYTLDNNQKFKYYELQKVNEVHTKENKKQITPTREQMNKQKTIKRRLKKDGIELERITNKKRKRKITDRLTYK